ncbi:MAG: sigma-54-dependent Fis family transcriptional regulator [Bdellovibrionales bacterium]|nr:sigma-54-dependent Fis family transcriptional regulator [Bdellovibrionales bacterium]
MKDFKGRIVIVDDDREMRSLLEDFLGSSGYLVHVFPLASEALEALSPGGRLASDQAEGDVDLIISDIRMPQLDGLDFTTRLQSLRPEVPTVLITAFGSIETAIEAMRRGAFHYVVKPFKLAEMAVNVERAMEHRKLQRDNTALRQEVKRSWSMGGIVGKSPGMKAVFDLVNRVSQATANVLITGESGTGKEMVARAIHESGPRARRAFVAINCTAIPETLLESELFGHAKGSFTGAIQRKRGLFEEADGGTLFLDEIGDMNVQLQSKLLRVIQEKKVRAVGENVDRPVDVRIVAATHKDLKAAIKDGRFREDLYYRLSVIPIVIPPLRHRREDIPLLAEHFLRKYSAANGLRVKGFTQRAIAKLMELRWDGNVRELENVVERAVVLAQAPLIDAAEIPTMEAATAEQFFGSAIGDFPTVEQLEKRYIQVVLEKTGGRKDKAAQILGFNRRTLYRKEREYGLVEAGAADEQSEDHETEEHTS